MYAQRVESNWMALVALTLEKSQSFHFIYIFCQSGHLLSMYPIKDLVTVFPIYTFKRPNLTMP